MNKTDYQAKIHRRQIPFIQREWQAGYIWPFSAPVFGLGIYLGERCFQITMSPYFWIASILLWLLSVTIFKRQKLFLLMAIMALGMMRLGQVYALNETKMMSYRDYGDVQGRIVDIDRSYSERVRVTLDSVLLNGEEFKGRYRLSLFKNARPEDYKIGQNIKALAHITPVNGPSDLGGFDFRRYAWSKQIAAVGYTQKPVEIFSQAEGSFYENLHQFRRKIALNLVANMGANRGGFAASIMVGERSFLTDEVETALKHSSLAHLLAISGMHMGAICALSFWSFRLIFGGFSRYMSGRISLKLSIIFAILMTGFYWIISGMAYSATRAFLMSLLIFLAMLLGRRAISMQNVMIAAMIILFIDPLALFHAGFQMSFAATAAMIIVFERMNLYRYEMAPWLRWFLILMITSFVAGIATAPFLALHFNELPRFGLLANILAMPVMSFFVMPMVLLSFILMPFGLDSWVYEPLSWGLAWVIHVGSMVSSWENPIWRIPQTSHASIAFMILGMAIYYYCEKPLRHLCLVAFSMSLILWSMVQSPDLLIANDARFFGLKINDERVVSRATGHRFLAEVWAKREGMALEDLQALSPSDPMVLDLPKNWRLVFSTTKKGGELARQYCAYQTIIIAAQVEDMEGECRFFNQWHIRKMGGVAINFREEGRLEVFPLSPDDGRPWR